jgi:hypothetical protein
MAADVAQLTSAEAQRGIEVFSRRSLERGGRKWTLAEVEGSAILRLYRATATRHWMLDKSGEGPRYDHPSR